MPFVVSTNPSGVFDSFVDALHYLGQSAAVAASDTRVALAFGDVTYVLRGAGLAVSGEGDARTISGGTISRIEIDDARGGSPERAYVLDGLSLAGAALGAAITGGRDGSHPGVQTLFMSLDWTLDGGDAFILSAFTGDNTLALGPGYDEAAGGSGADTLFGGAGDDRLFGNGGDDRLHAGSGDLGTGSLFGGAGDDRLFLDTSASEAFGGAGDDAIYGGQGAGRARGGAGDDAFIGGAARYDFVGGEGRDALRAGSGGGRADGGADADALGGGDRVDLLLGGAGADRLWGHDGDDRLWGGTGADVLRGGGGRDDLRGGRGDDALAGRLGDDRIAGGAGRDLLSGGQGADAFVFLLPDLGVGARRDVVLDFASGRDVIDLTALDLVDRGTAGFTGAGQVRFDAGRSLLLIETTGDGVADAQIELAGVAALGAGDVLV